MNQKLTKGWASCLAAVVFFLGVNLLLRSVVMAARDCGAEYFQCVESIPADCFRFVPIPPFVGSPNPAGLPEDMYNYWVAYCSVYEQQRIDCQAGWWACIREEMRRSRPNPLNISLPVEPRRQKSPTDVGGSGPRGPGVRREIFFMNQGSTPRLPNRLWQLLNRRSL